MPWTEPKNGVVCQHCRIREGLPVKEQVNRISLNDGTVAHLRSARFKIICDHCLQEFDEMAQFITSAGLSADDPLIEGRDYTVENGLYVFTTFYHMRRGYCCGNGCKHCAYGIYLEQS